jgi:hypothetical protein
MENRHSRQRDPVGGVAAGGVHVFGGRLAARRPAIRSGLFLSQVAKLSEPVDEVGGIIFVTPLCDVTILMLVLAAGVSSAGYSAVEYGSRYRCLALR